MYDNDNFYTSDSCNGAGVLGLPVPDPAQNHPRRVLARGGSLALGCVAAMVGGVAHAANITDEAFCYPCDNVSAMTSAAVQWARTQGLPPETYFLMVSQGRALAVVFKTYINAKGNIIALAQQNCSTQASCLQAALDLDNRILARSAEVLPVRLNSPASSSEATVSTEIEGILVYNNQSGFDPLHWLTWTPPIVTYWWQYVDKQTNGQVINIFLNETITVIYPDGSMEKFYLSGGAAGTSYHPWHRVPGSHVDKNGKPYVVPSTTPAKPLAGISNETNYWPNGTIHITPSPAECWGSSSVTITAPNGDSLQGSGVFSYGC